MNNKNIVVGVSCLYPSQYPKSVWGNREKDYYLSMKSLLNLNIDFDFMFIDNSINDINEIKHEGLKNILIDYSFDYSGYAVNFKGNKDIFSEDHNIGYEKLILSIIDNQYILNHDFITILNLRRYFISSFWFFLCEKLLFSEQHDILLLDSKEYKMENMEAISKQSNISIEDNLFSMNNNLFIRYIDFLQKNKSQKIHKEKLWNFSELKKPYVVNNAGLVRNDWDINKQDFNFNNLTFS